MPWVVKWTHWSTLSIECYSDCCNLRCFFLFLSHFYCCPFICTFIPSSFSKPCSNDTVYMYQEHAIKLADIARVWSIFFWIFNSVYVSIKVLMLFKLRHLSCAHAGFFSDCYNLRCFCLNFSILFYVPVFRCVIFHSFS